MKDCNLTHKITYYLNLKKLIFRNNLSDVFQTMYQKFLLQALNNIFLLIFEFKDFLKTILSVLVEWLSHYLHAYWQSFPIFKNHKQN